MGQNSISSPNHHSDESLSSPRGVDLYGNFIPISLLGVMVPVLVMGVSSYFSTESNTEKIEILRQDRQKFDIFLSEKITSLDDKLDNLAITLTRATTNLENMSQKIEEIKDKPLSAAQERKSEAEIK